MSPPRITDIVSVARRLTGLATTQPDSALLLPVAGEVIQLLNQVEEGRIATNQECSDFLQRFLPYMPALSFQDLPAIREVLERTKEAEVRRAPRNPNQLEYRIERPTAFAPDVAYSSRRSQKPAADDISEKVATAFDAMKAAQCTRAYDCVGEILAGSGLIEKMYCTKPHLKSRIRRLGRREPLLEQEDPRWLNGFWHTLHPELRDKIIAGPTWPEKFKFKKCDC